MLGCLIGIWVGAVPALGGNTSFESMV